MMVLFRRSIGYCDLQEISGRREGTTCCSGHCKAAVRRIVEQVRADTEQWSQLQEMLVQVRDEMAELQASRDFWEDRAVKSDTQYQSLHSTVRFVSCSLIVVVQLAFGLRTRKTWFSSCCSLDLLSKDGT